MSTSNLTKPTAPKPLLTPKPVPPDPNWQKELAARKRFERKVQINTLILALFVTLFVLAIAYALSTAGEPVVVKFVHQLLGGN